VTDWYGNVFGARYGKNGQGEKGRRQRTEEDQVEKSETVLGIPLFSDEPGSKVMQLQI
jgi:hypothetical protein